jgi:hypothetical protein
LPQECKRGSVDSWLECVHNLLWACVMLSCAATLPICFTNHPTRWKKQQIRIKTSWSIHLARNISCSYSIWLLTFMLIMSFLMFFKMFTFDDSLEAKWYGDETNHFVWVDTILLWKQSILEFVDLMIL